MKKVKIEFYFNKSTYVLKSMINIFKHFILMNKNEKNRAIEFN